MTTITTVAQRLLDENNYIAMDTGDTTETTIAQKILDQNNYTTTDISIVNLEYLINLAVNFVNLMSDTDIAALSGAGGSKSLVGTKAENLAVQLVSTLLIRAYKDRGPNVAIGGLSVSTIIADPQYDQHKVYIETAITKIQKQISLTDMEYLIDNAIDWINLHADTSIVALSGAAASKSLVATNNQIVAVKALSSQMLENYATKKPLYIFDERLNKIVDRLKTTSREPPIYVSNDPVPTS